MTSTKSHNIKSILTQAILIALCIYGILQINFQRKVIKLKENIASLESLGVKVDSSKFIPSFGDKLTLNSALLNSSLTKTIDLVKKNDAKLEGLFENNKLKLESQEAVIRKLNIDNKQEVLKDSSLYNIVDSQVKAIKSYDVSIKDYQAANKNNSNPFWGIIRNDLFDMLNKMSIEDLIGQLMVIGVEGQTLGEAERKGLEAFKPGGVILMGKNIDNIDQTKKLTSQLKATNPSIPLIIATDQEGGEVKRVSWDNTPGQNEWANIPKDKMCENANTRADILREIGINLNLAPVADLGNNDAAFINNRTVGTDPNLVSTKIREYRECFDKKVMSTLKHFPGHGMVTEDSHSSLPVNTTTTKEQWVKTHSEPFLKNIDAPFIMTSHVQIDQIDQRPTSMSAKWIKDILKVEYSYKGIVITDDMQQYADISKADKNKSALDALVAGNDMLLFVPSYSDVAPIKAHLVNEYKDRRNVIEGAVLKILLAKSQII